ncbi:MAG TPA: PIG-L family deacetylase [Nitrosopumilaceae archaeon]|jgi:LmbE family N-acetylglucosaminyl deacetylase|nr:PIG-L family deacetylase [Nitrosopumilaceae archaeon]
MKLFISPHNDDESLFGAFTIQRENCQVVIVFDSFIQTHRGYLQCSAVNRRDESIQACKIMGVDPPIFLGFSDAEEYTPYLEEKIIIALKRRFKAIEAVWSPAEEEYGHAQHNMVARACRAAFGPLIKDQYLTYVNPPGQSYKSISGKEVPTKPDWVFRKLQALACYYTQVTISELGCWPHFLRSQYEYYL